MADAGTSDVPAFRAIAHQSRAMPCVRRSRTCPFRHHFQGPSHHRVTTTIVNQHGCHAPVSDGKNEAPLRSGAIGHGHRNTGPVSSPLLRVAVPLRGLLHLVLKARGYLGPRTVIALCLRVAPCCHGPCRVYTSPELTRASPHLNRRARGSRLGQHAQRTHCYSTFIPPIHTTASAHQTRFCSGH